MCLLRVPAASGEVKQTGSSIAKPAVQWCERARDTTKMASFRNAAHHQKSLSVEERAEMREKFEEVSVEKRAESRFIMLHPPEGGRGARIF